MLKYAFTKVKCGSVFFFFFFNLLSSGHFPLCFDHLLLYPEGGTTTELYHNRDKYVFEFSQGHVTKNQPVAVPI